MENFKKGKLITIIQEFLNTGNKYQINGIDVSSAVFFARKPQGQYEPIPKGNYSITQESNNQYLNITNTDYLGTIESIQIGIEFASVSSMYDIEFNVDINILKDKYNQLVTDVKNLFKYAKKNLMIADALDVDIVLPQLDVDEVWVRTETGYRGFNIGSLETNVKQMIEELKQLGITLKQELNDLSDKLKLEIQGSFDAEIKAGKEAITQAGNEEVGIITDLADDKKTEITQHTDEEIKRIQATGIDSKFDKGGVLEDDYNNAVKVQNKLKTTLIKADTIEMLKAMDLKINDVVEVLGYYEKSDGATHKRIISSEDDGSGVQLSNGLWANIVHNGEVNVSWFGITNKDITIPIQKALDLKGVDIVLNKGDYKLSSKIRIYNNTHLDFNNSNIEVTKDYCSWVLGDFNIGEIKNVTIRNVRIFANSKFHCNILFMNGTNLKFENIIFDNVCNSYGHNIDMAGGKGIIVDNCKFLGKFYKAEDVDFKEYIQLDYAEKVGVPNYYSETANYSKQSVKNLIIKNCLFRYSEKYSDEWQGVCIGSHGVNEEVHKNIIIENCLFLLKNNRSAIHLLGIDNVKISKNSFIVEDYLDSSKNYQVIEVESQKYGESTKLVSNLNINNNNFESKETKNGTANRRFIYFNALEKEYYTNININNNTVTCKNLNERLYCFFIKTANNVVVSGNVFNTLANKCIQVNSCKDYIITNNSGSAYTQTLISAVSDSFSFDREGINGLISNNSMYFKKDIQEPTFEESGIYLVNQKNVNLTNNITNGIITTGGVLNNNIIVTNNHAKKISINAEIKILKDNLIDNVPKLSELNTPYMATKMQQEGVYNDFISYMDEKTLYDKQQEKLEQDKVLAYEEELKTNPNLTYEEFLQKYSENSLSTYSRRSRRSLMIENEEPQPSEALKRFMEKWL